ncbi:MAG: FAD-dependent oxidoreductase [Flavobacteriaceae bacterium]|nr:MAG: FAD-dependent oxidoreductase [Flavobacteriaceae bacterium]
MNYSYWEYKEWFSKNDFVIVGSGIVGLNCAIHLKNRFPKATILILERGLLPQGASTKTAGFACFGSVSELVSDLKIHSEEEVFNLIEKRWKGLQLLRNILGDHRIDYQHHYGYELFLDHYLFEECNDKIHSLNRLLSPVFKKNVFSTTANIFDFQKIVPKYILNHFEGQIDPGKMMVQLLRLSQQKGIKILHNVTVEKFSESADKVTLQTNHGAFITSRLLLATNGFSKELISENIEPARAQVLITKPIKDLHIKGAFHLDEGYYYFRNINNRILLGGGRNLDFLEEETTEFGQTKVVQDKLEKILRTIIFPNTTFEIERRWSGIMGVGNKKKPIVKQISNNVYCGIRLGGMGVSIGSLVGAELANLVDF